MNFEEAVDKFVFTWLRDNERTIRAKEECAALVFGMMCFPFLIEEIEDDSRPSYEERYIICNDALHGDLFELAGNAWNFISQSRQIPPHAKHEYFECMKTLQGWLQAGGPCIS